MGVCYYDQKNSTVIPPIDWLNNAHPSLLLEIVLENLERYHSIMPSRRIFSFVFFFNVPLFFLSTERRMS